MIKYDKLLKESKACAIVVSPTFLHDHDPKETIDAFKEAEGHDDMSTALKIEWDPLQKAFTFEDVELRDQFWKFLYSDGFDPHRDYPGPWKA